MSPRNKDHCSIRRTASFRGQKNLSSGSFRGKPSEIELGCFIGSQRCNYFGIYLGCNGDLCMKPDV